MNDDSAVDLVVKAVNEIDEAEFKAYRGGWPNEIGTALIDAVYSIRARYDSQVEGRGVRGRLEVMRSEHPSIRNDLVELAHLGESEIRAVMGHGKSAKRFKSACVIEAAKHIQVLGNGVRTADDARAVGIWEVQNAYTSVTGLGAITGEYFCMLLGEPGVKADRMVVRFVEDALNDSQGRVTSDRARRLVESAFARTDVLAENLTAFEHGIWRFQRAKSAEAARVRSGRR